MFARKLRRARQLAAFYGSVVVGRQPVRRRVTVFPDDTFITSYPKSGNTWTRFLIANLLRPGGEVDFLNIQRIVPDMYRDLDPALRRLPRPRVLKSHEPYTPGYPKVLLIVRDPRDIALSYFHYKIAHGVMDPDTPIAEFVERFVTGRVDGFGPWGENVGSWLGAREGDDAFLMLRYEDIKANTPGALRKIAGLIGVEADDATIEQAVKDSSFDRMRELDSKQQWNPTQLKGATPFVRKASAGGWRDDLPAESVQLIESHFGSVMSRLGYL